MTRRDSLKRLLQAIGVCLMTVSVCVLLYSYDNKYTTHSPRGTYGTVTLTEADAGRLSFLISSWAVYGNVLLTPEDLEQNAPIPDEYIFIGQYGGLEHLTGSPHGSVTYRLVIGIPKERRSYMLALPEIYSSCRVYINGVKMLALGETDPRSFSFETGSAAITFEAAGEIDLLIAVSDYKHFYSGMVYPPALGAPDAVMRMLNIHTYLRLAVCSAALIIGVIALLIGIMNKSRGVALLFGLLCLFFIGAFCYPVVMTLTRGSLLFYAIENVSFYAMLLVIMILQGAMMHKESRIVRLHPFMIGFGAFVCLITLIMPFVTPIANLSYKMVYSTLITICKWATAGYITLAAGAAVWRRPSDDAPLFFGMLAFVSTLVMDRILPLYEPIVSGWFYEIGSFVLILSVGLMTAREVVKQYRENAVIEERVKIILSSGRDYYEKISAMQDTLRILRHDVKHHIHAAREMLRSGSGDELDGYLSDVESLVAEDELPIFCNNTVVNSLLAGYRDRCRKLDIHYSFEVALPDSIPNYEMCVVFGNLLENAVEACVKHKGKRYIKLEANYRYEQFAIVIENSFDGHIISDNGQYISGKKDGGYGLRSVAAVAERYGGKLLLNWEAKIFKAYVSMQV